MSNVERQDQTNTKRPMTERRAVAIGVPACPLSLSANDQRSDSIDRKGDQRCLVGPLQLPHSVDSPHPPICPTAIEHMQLRSREAFIRCLEIAGVSERELA